MKMSSFVFVPEEEKVKSAQKIKSANKNSHTIANGKYVDICSVCGLFEHCNNPKMPVTGKGLKRILIVGEVPEKVEDETGIQFTGSAGKILRSYMAKFGIDIDKDCWKTNAVICRPPKNKIPSLREIKCCRSNLISAIQQLKPNKIFAFGKIAIQSLLLDKISVAEGEKFFGLKIPLLDYGCWLYCNYPLQYLIYNFEDESFNVTFERYIKEAAEHSEPLPNIQPNIKLIYSMDEARTLLRTMSSNLVAIDYETTGVKPVSSGHRILCMSVCDGDCSYVFEVNELLYPDIITFLENDEIKKIGHNIKYETVWSKKILGCDVKGWVWDTMTAAHCIDNRKGITGLKFQAFLNFGIYGYGDEAYSYMELDETKANRMDKMDISSMLNYCAMDSYLTFRLFEKQKRFFKNNKNLIKGVNFLLHGQEVFASIEQNGIRIDYDYFLNKENELSAILQDLKQKINNSEEVKQWPTNDFNFNSAQQLSRLLFDILKYKPMRKTKSGNIAVDSETLQELNTPLTNLILQYKKYEKIRGTYISSISSEIVDGFIYPNFNLNLVSTFRSSSDKPNFQNIPKRDEEAQKIIRSGIVAREGRQLLEIDYSAMEVRISACYHYDDNMIYYINNPDSDMHRDVAKLLFKKDEVSKFERYLAKNKFVFPQFYGDYYKNCAKNIWAEIQDELLPIFKNYDNFENHVKDIEHDFWNKKFAQYKEWKDIVWKHYLKTGYVKLKTGFVCRGYMNKNQVTNYPIQGSAFHCLLWSLIQLDKYIKENGLRTLIIGQIHDSVILDAVPDELKEICRAARYIMTQKIREEWDWIIVPLDIEAKVSEINGNWFAMSEISI